MLALVAAVALHASPTLLPTDAPVVAATTLRADATTTKKKRKGYRWGDEKVVLTPELWALSIGSAAMIGGGTTMFLLARQEEAKLIRGDPSITTDAELRATVARGKLYNGIAIGAATAGFAGLATAFGLYYWVVAPAQGVFALAPTADGGAMAMVSGKLP